MFFKSKASVFSDFVTRKQPRVLSASAAYRTGSSTKKMITSPNCFSNNWAISCALIGPELCSIRVTFFARSLARDVPRQIKGNGRQKLSRECYCEKQIDNHFPWSVLSSTIAMTSKLCSESTRLRFVVPLEFWIFWSHFYGW